MQKYVELHDRLPEPSMKQSFVNLMRNVKPGAQPMQTLQAVRYGLSHFENKGERFLPEEHEDRKMGFERHGGLGPDMLADIGIEPGQHAHTTYHFLTPHGPRELGYEEENQMTRVLGEGNTALERLARHAEKEPEELSKSMHEALQAADVNFQGTRGAFHGVDIVRKGDAVALHVHAIHLPNSQGKPRGPEHVVIPIGKQSLTLARQVRDYIKEATGKNVPRLKTQ